MFAEFWKTASAESGERAFYPMSECDTYRTRIKGKKNYFSGRFFCASISSLSVKQQHITDLVCWSNSTEY
jgi:hypothetical protein